VNLSFVLVIEVPTGVVTVTSTIPVPAGLRAVICVSLINVTWVAGDWVAGDETKYTWVTPVKPEPVMVTCVPPVIFPWFGMTFVTVGIVGR